LPVETAAVESLYWRLNIRAAVLGQTSPDPAPPTNAKFRDSRKDRWFVFCHGYNVNDHDARGWNAELFKRLHQKGSNAKFVGVSWEGNQGQLGANLPFDKVFTPDYWRNSYNAFASSQVLAAKINSLTANTQSKAVIAGHSMGNIIASSALCDHGLKAEQYFLLNAAVAREAYSNTHVASDRNSVRHPDWSSYPIRLWSSDWFSLFPAADGRNKLTWQGRFANISTVTNPHNYYSSTEDVLANGDGITPPILDLVFKDTGAWIKQEMSKGLATKAFVTGTGANNWTSNGGWAFNPDHYLNYRPDPLNPPSTLPDTSAITVPQLRANPFFKPFTKLKLQGGGAVADAANGIDLAGGSGSTHATEYSIRAWLLSHDVPALSNPTGRNPVSGWSTDIDQSNTDMDTIKFQWGAWKHSDLKNAPIDAVGKLYESMIERGNLK
jgi:pimeloyl-ACP methyl ester carboxylesterase